MPNSDTDALKIISYLSMTLISRHSPETPLTQLDLHNPKI